MKSQQHGQTLPNSNTLPPDPDSGSRFNYKTTPRGFLVARNVACNPNLPDGAKLMWGVIRQLQNESGACYSSDEYLGQCVNAAPRTARGYCLALRKEGLLEEVRRLGRPPLRYLLWQPSFKTDRKGSENPGPDDGQNGAPEEQENMFDAGPDSADTSAETRRRTGSNLPTHPNLMIGDLIGDLIGNNNPTPGGNPTDLATPGRGVAVAKKGKGKPGPEGNEKQTQMVAELRTRGVLELSARKLVAELPEDFPFLDALDFYQHQATAPGSRIKNAPGFIVTMLQGRILPPANWETRAQRAARERDERERAELDARQMDLDLQAEAQLDAAADAKVAELKTVAPAKYAELMEKGKAHLAERSPSARRELESRSFGPMLRGQVEQCVWAIVRSELRAQHYNRKSLPAETA
jgi:hypothetical protein